MLFFNVFLRFSLAPSLLLLTIKSIEDIKIWTWAWTVINDLQTGKLSYGKTKSNLIWKYTNFCNWCQIIKKNGWVVVKIFPFYHFTVKTSLIQKDRMETNIGNIIFKIMQDTKWGFCHNRFNRLNLEVLCLIFWSSFKRDI